MLYAIIAIILFGVLIAAHEAGHMFMSKAFGVKVNEYAVGMGPCLFKRKKGETEYSLRLLPIGGYCAIEGEADDSEDERALCNQKAWKQVLVFVAGVAVNFLIGLIITFFLYIGAKGFINTEIVALNPDFPTQGEEGLMIGDEIYSIDGYRTYLASDIQVVLAVADKGENGEVGLEVLRDGQLLSRTISLSTFLDEEGNEYTAYGFSYGGETPGTLKNRLWYTWVNTIDFVRLVGFNFKLLFSGNVGLDDFRGPVGIVSEITNMGQEAEAEDGIGAALETVFYYMAMISVNLAVMNLLPIPALDGGHILTLFVKKAFRKVFRKNLSLKFEQVITAGSFVVVLGLMAVITLKDIIRLF